MASGTFAVGGLMSGIDTDNMFMQLEQVYRKPVELLEARKDDYNVTLSAYSTLEAKLKALRTAAEAFDTSSEFQSLSASSGDTSYITASASSSAVAGDYDIDVVQMAKAHVIRVASTFKSDDTVGEGTLHIQVGNGTEVDVTVGATDTIADVASSINATDDVGVTAAAIYDGNRYNLVLTAKNTGDENIINVRVDDTGAAAAGGYAASTDNVGLSRLAYNNFETNDSVAGFTSSTSTIADGGGAGGIVTINDTFDIIIASTDTLEDIANKINDTSNWFVKGSTTTAYTVTANTKIPKAAVVEDVVGGVGTGLYHLRVDGVDTWESTEALLNMDSDFQTTNTVSRLAGLGFADRDTTTYDYIFRINGADTTNYSGAGAKTLDGMVTQFNLDWAGTYQARVTTGDDGLYYLDIANNNGTGGLTFDNIGGDLTGYVFMDATYAKHPERIQKSQDSKIIINGDTDKPIYSTTNTVNAIPGLAMNLKKVTSSSVTVSVTSDTTSIVSKIQNYATAYNDLIDFFDENQGPKQTSSGDLTLEEKLDNLITILSGENVDEDDSDVWAPLHGDSTTTTIKSLLQSLTYKDVEGLTDTAHNSLAEIGITFNYGKIDVNTSTLTSAITTYSDAVTSFFTTDPSGATTYEKGFATRMVDAINDIVEKYKGSSKGLLVIRQEGLDTTIDDLDDRIIDLEDRIDADLERLRAQFNSLETLMGQLQTQSSYVANYQGAWQ